jgi:hypothetical protein
MIAPAGAPLYCARRGAQPPGVGICGVDPGVTLVQA